MNRLKQVITEIIREKWPLADRIEPAGKCPNCRAHALWSFILPEWDVITWDGTYQLCGHWCENCGWSQPGARKISQMDSEAHGGAGKGEP